MEQAEGRREGEEKEVKKLEKKKEEVEEERPTPGWGRAEALPGQGRTLSSWGPVPSAAHFFPLHFKLGNCSVGNKSGVFIVFFLIARLTRTVAGAICTVFIILPQWGKMSNFSIKCRTAMKFKLQ